MMQNKNYTAQKLEEKYIPQLVEIENACFSDPWSYEGFLFEVTNPNSEFAVVTLDNEVLGYICMHHILDEGYIANVAVKKAYRRQGIAGFLMENMIQYATENKFAVLTLEVRESNLDAQALYAKYRFKQLGVRKNYYLNPQENGLILALMF